ncbi:MAG: hypothetical protein KY468_08135 [Armatimonadetes bacterium]|nr:hypothetical protein [Armatimonadota bacterium]
MTFTPLSTIKPLVKDSVKGTCEEFNRHLKNTGVKDANGKTHPRYAGWASTEFNYRYTYTSRSVRENGGIRLHATVQVKFTGTATPARLDWIPTASLSSVCLKEKLRWEKHTEEHEARHVQDFEKLMRSVHHRYKSSIPFSAWGATVGQAQAELDRRIKTTLDRETTELDAQIDKDAESFHRTPQGGTIIDIDCNACAS